MEKNEKDPQYAFGISVIEDGTYKIFQNTKPKFPKIKQNQTKSSKIAIHSEETLLDHMIKFQLQNEKKVTNIFIFSNNNPCLKRDHEIIPCMFLILTKAWELYEKYGTITDVAFTKFWGLDGPNYFRSLSSKDILHRKSPFKVCVSECKTIPFKLDHNNLKKIFKQQKIVKKWLLIEDKKTLSENIIAAQNTLVELAETKIDLYKKLMDLVNQEIDSSAFQAEERDKVCEMLKKSWKEMVDNSFMSSVKKYIAAEFNKAVVLVFSKKLELLLGKNSFLRLHLIPRAKLIE